MYGARILLGLLLLALLPVAAQDAKGKTGTRPSRNAPKRALNRAFKGRILKLKKRKVTLFYDFEDPAQIEDFESARPPRFLDASQNKVKIQGGRLVLEGSTSIRHKMESTGRIWAKFTVRLDKKRNVGAVITEPMLSDFYVVYNLFDYRFNMSGNMHIGACGLREDEGAEDLSTDLVNFRDIFNGNLKKKVKIKQDVEVEVWKERWTEFFRVNDVKGKGSSKGKTRDMRSYKFGLFVHESRASFDNLTLTCELSDEYLDFANLRAEIDATPAAPQDPVR